MAGFDEYASVVVRQLDDREWEVVAPFAYEGRRDVFRVESGMRTDFASVPRVFVWFLPRYGRYTLAAILHDHLWSQLAARGRMSYRDADGLFRRAMRELGVPFLRRWMMWAAVRWGALVKPDGRRGWWREAPRVLLVTVLALPVLLPPALLVGLALAVFFAVEWIVWLPLRVGQACRRRLSPTPAKQVNRPRVEWRL